MYRGSDVRSPAGYHLKLVNTEILVDKGNFSSSEDWLNIRDDVEAAIMSMEWPLGSGKFVLYDEQGKGRGKGNGVKPIKEMFASRLCGRGDRWKRETEMMIPARLKPGKIDISTKVNDRVFGIEWETGNISSSHRALNKLAMGLLNGFLIGGILITPTRKMYNYLTDRVGNFEELSPYFPIWKSIPISEGLLAVIAVEHDEVSKKAPKFHKGTNGRALA
jgi:hypothetical protein